MRSTSLSIGGSVMLGLIVLVIGLLDFEEFRCWFPSHLQH
jgi:hypothetical protein